MITPPLRLRYATNIDTGALPVVTTTNFVKTMDVLKSKDISWHFYAVLALAKNDEEAQSFRNLIKKTIANAEYKNIIVVDALSTPLGLEAFEDYVNYSAIDIEPYDWNDDPRIKQKIQEMASVEYNAGGSDIAISTIDSMPVEQLKEWLKTLAINDMELGVKIISNGGK